jgi:hypothetical protein
VTEGQDGQPDLAQACHQMLLQLAGRAPDDLLTQCRDWLARGEFADLARCVTFWTVSQDVALAEAEVVLLSALLAEADADPRALTHIRIEDAELYPYYGFAPEIPPGLDGSNGAAPAQGKKTSAKVEEAAVKAVGAEPGAVGVWRAWRFPSDGAPWPPPKRVFVVEVRAGVDEPDVAARLQGRLTTAGEASPQVEVYQTGDQLPAYQELGRAYGELLWAAAADPGIEVAAVFDEVDAETGPCFRPDHPQLAEDEADRIVKYLYAGEPLLVTTSRMDDLVDTSQTYCVPMSFRTDGTWIWSDASAYYAERHRLEPDAALVAHLRSNDYTVPLVDGVAVYRALAVLQEPADEEPEWTVDSGSPALAPESAGS